MLMRITRRTAVMIAVICAAGAALLSVIYLKSLSPKAATPAVTTVAVPVPTVALTAGTRITADKLVPKDIPHEQVGPDVITKQEDLVGQELAMDVPAGEPITKAKLAEFSSTAGLAFVVTPGMRAVTVAVDNITGVSGFLKLGDRVDVLATFETSQGAITRTILQDIEVLGLGAESMSPKPPEEPKPQGAPAPAASSDQAPPAAKPSATLAVTPEQAQVLVLSAIKGRLLLALRSKGDARIVALPPATNTGVVGVAPTPPTPPAANPAAQTVGAESAASGRAGAGLTPSTTVGPDQAELGGKAGATAPAAPSGPPKPSVEVFKGTTREVVTP
jgi:pilus assembly protein CpaB